MKSLFISLAFTFCAVSGFAQNVPLVSFESLEDKAIEEVVTYGDDRAYFLASKVKLSSVNGKVTDKVYPPNVDFDRVVIGDNLPMGMGEFVKNTDRIPSGFYHVSFDDNSEPIVDEDFGYFSFHRQCVEDKYEPFKMFSKPRTTLTKAITQISGKFDLSKVEKTLVVQYRDDHGGISFNIGNIEGSEPSYYRYIPLKGRLEYVDYEEPLGD